jgi:hypothetical protein
MLSTDKVEKIHHGVGNGLVFLSSFTAILDFEARRK